MECRRFEVVYPGASEPALSLTSFVVAQGEKVALLGPNGCGKTSLLAALVGYAPWNGEVKVFGDVPRGRTLSLVRSHAGCLFDDPDAQFLFPTVREDVAHALGRRDDAKVDALLDSVGLGPGNRPVATLSRGQRQRAALAGVLAAEPPLLLLDEPTAALDDREKARLAALLAALPAAVVVATHDRAFAAALGARIEELGR